MPKDDAVFLVPRRHVSMDGAVSQEAKRKLDWFDSWHQAQGSPYEDPDWTLASAIKWIAERTRDAVDRPSVDELAAQQAVCALQDALALGEVRLTGSTALHPVPRLFPPETWATYQVCLLEEGGLLWPCILHDATEREDLLYVRLRRDEVLRRWPPHDSSEAGPLNSVSKETACRGWLTKMMRENSDKPRPKTQIRAEASNKFPGLGKNAFDRAWARAVQDSGATAWGAPGRGS